jgi:tRNA threonylcarbamoyl adenosine modification protein (Sua5/YciO/YrdC/YwlC family)
MEKLIKLIKQGKIFVYPTDTVYGLGCNALNKKAVEKIKIIKKRKEEKSLSIIAPSKAWIFKHLKAKKEIVNKYLPGRYTLILKKKNPKFLNHVSSQKTLGIRIPKNDFTGLIVKAKVPFITTSANISGNKPIANLNKIDKKLLKKVDVIVDGGKLFGKPSTIILENGSKLKR